MIKASERREDALIFAAIALLWVMGSMALLGPVALTVAAITMASAFVFGVQIVGALVITCLGAAIGILIWGAENWAHGPVNSMIQIYREVLFDGYRFDVEGLVGVFGRMLVHYPAWPYFALLVASRFLASPLILYPASPSLPKGPYLRTFGTVETGKIVAFPMPEAARRYETGLGHDLPVGFSFMKPIVAGPGDHVCNSVGDGLMVNGQWRGLTLSHDRAGRPLPVWAGCRPLGDGQYFMFSDYVPNSFDSRYFGPIAVADIVGVYRPLF